MDNFALKKSTKFAPSDVQRDCRKKTTAASLSSAAVSCRYRGFGNILLVLLPRWRKAQTRQASIKRRANFPSLFRAVSKTPSLLPRVRVSPLRTLTSTANAISVAKPAWTLVPSSTLRREPGTPQEETKPPDRRQGKTPANRLHFTS